MLKSLIFDSIVRLYFQQENTVAMISMMNTSHPMSAPRRSRTVSIATKLFFLTINAVAGILLITAFLLFEERASMLQERQNGVKQSVEIAYSTLAYYQARVEKNDMPLVEAQKAAMDAVRMMRYGDGEYFWINDMAPTMRMHPFKPALDNTDLSGTTDPTGKRLFVEMVDIVRKQGAGLNGCMRIVGA
ncbi:MAG: hypothetical protein EOP02_04450, partial [Proteobacteria bacterium]